MIKLRSAGQIRPAKGFSKQFLKFYNNKEFALRTILSAKQVHSKYLQLHIYIYGGQVRPMKDVKFANPAPQKVLKLANPTLEQKELSIPDIDEWIAVFWNDTSRNLHK